MPTLKFSRAECNPTDSVKTAKANVIVIETVRNRTTHPCLHIQQKQETKLSLTNRATHLRNIKWPPTSTPLPISRLSWLFCVKGYAHKHGVPSKLGCLGSRPMGTGACLTLTNMPISTWVTTPNLFAVGQTVRAGKVGFTRVPHYF